MAEGIVATVWGTKTRFCGEGCEENFREDKAGLIYPPCGEADENGNVKRDAEGNPVLIGWQEASYQYEWCAYCRNDLSARPAPTAVTTGQTH